MSHKITYYLLALATSVTDLAPHGTEFFKLNRNGTPDTTQRASRAMRWANRADAQAYASALNSKRWQVVGVEFDGFAKVGS